MTDVEQMAREYVELLNGPADGLGQHCHPVYGASHFMLGRMRRDFGHAAADAAVDAAFAERRRKIGEGLL